MPRPVSCVFEADRGYATGLTMDATFDTQHYLGVCSSLDTIFLVVHLFMTAVQKRVLVTSREQRVFEAAIFMLAAILLTKVFFRPAYNKHRSKLVFITHMVLTTLRAAATHTMAPRMAVHWRVSLAGNPDSPLVCFFTMLAVLGCPFRVFEPLGLQQPWQSHAIVTLFYMVVHVVAGMEGFRLAYSNAMFYLVHEVHDTVSAVVDAMTDGIAALPATQQATCSSCAGVAVYCTLLLFGSVAVPMYSVYTAETAARRRFKQRMLTATDTMTPTSAADPPANMTTSAAGPIQQQRQATHHAATTLLAQQQHELQQQAHARNKQTYLPAQQQQRPQGPAAAVDRAPAGPADSANSNPQQVQHQHPQPILQQQPPRPLRRQRQRTVTQQAISIPFCDASTGGPGWLVHCFVLLCLLMGSWVAANLVALHMLPRVLSSQQLDYWCPNKPKSPFVIAGRVYDEY